MDGCNYGSMRDAIRLPQHCKTKYAFGHSCIAMAFALLDNVQRLCDSTLEYGDIIVPLRDDT